MVVGAAVRVVGHVFWAAVHNGGQRMHLLPARPNVLASSFGGSEKEVKEGELTYLVGLPCPGSSLALSYIIPSLKSHIEL